MKIMGEKVLWAEETACKSLELEKRKKNRNFREIEKIITTSSAKFAGEGMMAFQS